MAGRLATNMILEGKGGARESLLTAGFACVEIGRQDIRAA